MEYRLIQDGMPVAWANSEREILHYAAVYGQDAPVQIQERIEKKGWRKYVRSSAA
jgi:hypothetical protein